MGLEGLVSKQLPRRQSDRWIKVKNRQHPAGSVRLSKIQSVDQRMRLECTGGFRQLRTCRRHVRGSYVPIGDIKRSFEMKEANCGGLTFGRLRQFQPARTVQDRNLASRKPCFQNVNLATAARKFMRGRFGSPRLCQFACHPDRQSQNASPRLQLCRPHSEWFRTLEAKTRRRFDTGAK